MNPTVEELIRRYSPTVLANHAAKAKAEGKAEGKAETLLRLARLRFGGVSKERARQVLAADEATLDRWLDTLVTAEDMEAVFNPPDDCKREHGNTHGELTCSG